MILLTIPQVAERLSLGRSTVYRMLDTQLPVYRLPNGAVRVAEADLDRFLTDCRQEPKPADPMLRPRVRRGERRGTFSRALEAVE